MNYCSVFGKVQTDIRQQTDRKRRLRAHRAICTGGLKNWPKIRPFFANFHQFSKYLFKCLHILLIYISEIIQNHTLFHSNHAENPILTEKLHKFFGVEGFRHAPVGLQETEFFFYLGLAMKY